MADKVYIHEQIDIIGHNRAKYMHHMTANWCPIAREERNQLCYGVWSVVGSTGAWPQTVNMWELDGWEGLAQNFAHELVGAGAQDPSLTAWWAEAASLRRGGFDRIVVPDGATCNLDGATVTGSVTVGTGSSLYTMGATIGGNVMSRDAATVRLIDSDLGHNVMITGTTGAVRIGSKGCKVDPAAALNVEVKNNLGNVAICDMSIGRNLIVTGNAGRTGLFRNTVGNNTLLFRNTGLANRVRDNTITNNLNCRHNTDKVISSGNTAGQIMGQCKA